MARRAMTSDVASLKKIGGHIKEHDFAELIGGEVNAGSQQDKKDVIDKQHRFHSVKGGQWWQIFLYRRSHWETNTVFKGLGDIANIMIACLDSFPQNFNDYIDNKHKYKIALQGPMKRLLKELNKPEMLPAFLSKALFNDGEVNYLSIHRENDECFHVFERSDVIDVLKNLNLENSRARNTNQYDCQKVVFRTNVNVGEIEVRNDGKQHYREMKCRFDGYKIFDLLLEKIEHSEQKKEKIIAYGKAINKFKIKPIA